MQQRVVTLNWIKYQNENAPRHSRYARDLLAHMIISVDVGFDVDIAMSLKNPIECSIAVRYKCTMAITLVATIIALAFDRSLY